MDLTFNEAKALEKSEEVSISGAKIERAILHPRISQIALNIMEWLYSYDSIKP